MDFKATQYQDDTIHSIVETLVWGCLVLHFSI